MIIFLCVFYLCFLTAANWKSADIHYITTAPHHREPDDEFNAYMRECHKRQVIEWKNIKFSPDVQKQSPSVLESPVSASINNSKIVYLTFDDGPSKDVTPLILDILKKYNIKATFFVVGGMINSSKPILLREFNEGHTIGNHTCSHKYNFIYASPENLLSEINEANKEIKTAFPDYKGNLFRFPGGSFDKSQLLKDSVTKAGYKYIDWNCLNGDAEGLNIPAEKLFERLKNTLPHTNPVIILMHDSSTKKTTADALPQIIEYLKSQGFTFKNF